MQPFTERQRIALAGACLRARDTLHPRFAKRGPTWSTIFTVNK